MGVFIAMFMVSIPALVKALFGVKEMDEFNKTKYQNVKKDIETVWANLQKIYKEIKK